jgi:hypothetical protein
MQLYILRHRVWLQQDKSIIVYEINKFVNGESRFLEGDKKKTGFREKPLGIRAAYD